MKYNFKHLKVGDYIFEKNFLYTDTSLKEKILKKYKKPNTLIMLDGKLIFVSVKDLILDTDLPKEAQAFNFFENEFEENNKRNLNAFLYLKTKANVDYGDIKIIFAFSSTAFLNVRFEFSKNSKIKIFQSFLCFNKAKISNFTSYSVKAGAQGEILHYQDLKNNSVLFCEGKIEGKVDFNFLSTSENKEIACFDFKLMKKRAECNVNSYLAANKKSENHIFFNIEHTEKDTTSRIDSFAVLNDFARVSYNGKTKISSKNKKSDADNKTKIINLYKGKAVVCPQLIIDEFDVKASHNFTLSELNPDFVYYLNSRGICDDNAYKILLLSYFKFLEKWTDEQKHIIKSITRKLKRRK